MSEGWDGRERRHEPGDGGRRAVDHEILPDCVQRTAEAVAEGHEMAARLELKIQEMRREREQQLAEINKAIALQSQNISALMKSQEKTAEEQKQLEALMAKLGSALDLLMKERDAKIQTEQEARKPIRAMWIGLLEKGIWFVVGIIVLALIEYAKARL